MKIADTDNLLGFKGGLLGAFDHFGTFKLAICPRHTAGDQADDQDTTNNGAHNDSCRITPKSYCN